MFIDIFLLVLVVALGALAWRFSMEALRLRSRYKSIVDIDAAVALSKAQLEEVRHAREEGDAAAARQRAEQELQHQQRLSAQTAAAQLDVEKMRRAREEEDTAAARERAEQERQHQQRLSEQTAAANHALEQVRREHEILLAQDQARRTELNEEYESARTRYEQLKRELALVEENVNDISFGLYEPHFTFQDPDEYKKALIALRARERDLIATGRAATCQTSWTVQDSQREGTRMVKQNIKLMLRAFNGECEAARGCLMEQHYEDGRPDQKIL